ncbi:MAG: hypothetical protein OSB38_38820, partial [Paraburkholderia fungorum]|nr:hypothetical protein [Paraburkholderia fungorum]
LEAGNSFKFNQESNTTLGKAAAFHGRRFFHRAIIQAVFQAVFQAALQAALQVIAARYSHG